jgi:hypothetical protein
MVQEAAMQLIGYTTSHSLHVKVHYGEGVLRIVMTGCMTTNSFRSCAAYAALQAASKPWTVVVYDLLGTVLAIGDGLDQPPIQSALTRIGRPGAYICDPITMPTMQRAAWQLAKLGVERTVFTSSAEAVRWARVRAIQIVASTERALARVRIARAEEVFAQLEQAASAR